MKQQWAMGETEMDEQQSSQSVTLVQRFDHYYLVSNP